MGAAPWFLSGIFCCSFLGGDTVAGSSCGCAGQYHTGSAAPGVLCFLYGEYALVVEFLTDWRDSLLQHTNSRNLTQGSIVKNLLIFAVPYLIANFIQAMYGAVDMAIVGWFADSAGISAVSTGSQVMQIVTSLVSGLTMGGTILIAQYFGANRRRTPPKPSAPCSPCLPGLRWCLPS